MGDKAGELEGGGNGELSEGNEQHGKVENAKSISQSKNGKLAHAESIRQPKDRKDESTESISEQVENADSNSQSKYRKLKHAESISHSKARKVENPENTQEAKYPPRRKKKFNKSKTSGLAKHREKLRSFGETMRKLWDVWSRFKTRNKPNPNPSISEKTLGVPGFEEIACIEAEVPDIMMMDKDRVRTSCKECMKDPPTFPTKEQIKAKLIAADKYYGVKSAKTDREQSDTTLEHEADYYDTDGRVVRPSWRFILERPLVEQYVLMTNYIRKVSVLSELKEDKSSKKYIEEEDSGSDTEYKKFEQKFIKEKRELLKPIQKPKTQDMAVQTSFEPNLNISEDLKESVSEISLYPESEESTNSPDASAVTIVTSRDCTSPLQSDFDGRTTDKSTSYRGGNWWESQATCEPSESFQTSYDSINKNTSSGSDGQPVPIHSAWGRTTLQPAKEAFSNESDSRIKPQSHSVEPSTHKKLKDSKKVSFSPVVTYYQGPNKNGSLYNLIEDQDIAMETILLEAEPQQGMETGNPPQNQITWTPTENKITEDLNLPEDQIIEETPINKEELPSSTAAERPKPKWKASLGNILQDKKRGQIVSVSLPADWHEDRILRNKKIINVAVSRTPVANQPTKKISFQEYEEIPDVEYSNPQVSKVQDRSDANIQTHTPVTQKSTPEKLKSIEHREFPRPKLPFDNRSSLNPGKSKIQPIDDSPEQRRKSRSPATPTRIPNAELNISERLGYEGTESIGTEPDIQTASSRLTGAGRRSETSRTQEQRFDDRRTMPFILDRASTSDETFQQVNSSKSGVQPSRVYTQAPLKDNSSHCTPQMEDTGCTHPRNTDAHTHSSTNSNQKPTDHISKISHNLPLIRDKSHSQQQQSTDTDGPSSSSNEHIKLKASPPCFFKVATPTDLSKISVDEFYPDVPEIDAELSQMSETKTSSAPQVEIVFANKESAARYIQETEFCRATKKEENIILQKSIRTTGNDSPITSKNAPTERNTIIASAGVGIKIGDDIRKSKDKRAAGSSYIEASKLPTKDSSQQSNITQNIRKCNLIAEQSLGEFEGESNALEGTQKTICKTDFGRALKKHGTNQECKVNQTVKLEEIKPINTQMVKDVNQRSALPLSNDLQNGKDIASRQKLNTSVITEPKPNVPTAPGKSVRSTGSFKKGEETMSYENTVNERTEIDRVQGENEKGGGTEKLERLVHDDDDKLITIERQLDSLPLDPVEQLMPHGRTKLYMRTLSSLAEETSSVVESTSSSTQEKVIDMPVVVRSVEELKTIFEKKLEVASVSAESELQVEESHSDPKKHAGLSKENHDNDIAFGKLVSVEMITATPDDAKKTAIRHLGHKSDGKFTNMGEEERSNSKGNQNLSPVVVKLEVSNDTDPTQAENGSVKADKLVKSENPLFESDKTPASIQEESSVQQLSQIDVIRASEIYSNTSMYFSSSEDRVAKLTKARTGFQPLTLDYDVASSARSRDTERTSNEIPGGPNKRHLGFSKNLASKEKFPEMANSASEINNDSKPKQQGIKLKTNHEGDNLSVGQGIQLTSADTRQKLGKEKGENEDPPTNTQEPSSKTTHTGIEKQESNQPKDLIKAMSRTDDTSNPSETKHWLMDVIPVLSKNTRLHGFRPHKPICVKEATEAEAVKYRQDAVKPVFRFLKRQREMDENKE